jgi:hypothetical protein
MWRRLRSFCRHSDTAAGGGAVFTSIGGPGSGQPAAVGILDDPYKDQPDAMFAGLDALDSGDPEDD